MSAFFKSLGLEKPTQDEKVRFIKGNVLKITHVELLSFFIFKSVPNFVLKQFVLEYRNR